MVGLGLCNILICGQSLVLTNVLCVELDSEHELVGENAGGWGGGIEITPPKARVQWERFGSAWGRPSPEIG